MIFVKTESNKGINELITQNLNLEQKWNEATYNLQKMVVLNRMKKNKDEKKNTQMWKNRI